MGDWTRHLSHGAISFIRHFLFPVWRFCTFLFIPHLDFLATLDVKTMHVAKLYYIGPTLELDSRRITW